MKTEGLQTH